MALVRSFEADVELTPRLSVGTVEPESIYEATLSATMLASATDNDPGAHVIQLPLPPQIVSLSDLEMKIDGQPTEAISIAGDKLVWTGTLKKNDPSKIEVKYSAVGRGLYALQTPPAKILDQFKIKLAAKGSDVRMLELSLQPTGLTRNSQQTTYVWDYKRLMFGRPIALDVLGIAPIDRLGELSWLGPMSVVCFGLLLGLIVRAHQIDRFDRSMLIMVIGTFTGAYPLMYFAQEFIPLTYAMIFAGGQHHGIQARLCRRHPARGCDHGADSRRGDPTEFAGNFAHLTRVGIVCAGDDSRPAAESAPRPPRGARVNARGGAGVIIRLDPVICALICRRRN
jgi:hypothetical protein